MLICIDIGNTHIHLGLIAPGGKEAAVATRDLPTVALDQLPDTITDLRTGCDSPVAIAFCSVVPDATRRLSELLDPLSLPLWHLTHEANLGVPITYPQPSEIGQDRLANAAGAKALGEPPAVVIDLGTAVTFDVISRAGGYEGGIITAGPALMARYLHERTAQLPLIEDVTSPVESAIGKSTKEALRIGAVLGFVGAIQACLDQVLGELTAKGESNTRIITAGGAASVVAGRLKQATTDVPDLALRGLAAAWELSFE
ncbi:MAG: pantothenate kinase [Synoicihabitans sp.]